MRVEKDPVTRRITCWHFFVFLIGALLTGATWLPVPSKVVAEDAWHREMAIHWSPFFYQASVNNYDIPTNFNFDGNWNGYDNWENAEWYINHFQTYVYYTVQESVNHYFLTYLVFHPRDTKFWSHENDLEGVRVVIDKDGSTYGRFWLMETFEHGNLHFTTNPTFINGSHPAVWIEAKGHGIWPWNNGVFPDGCGGDVPVAVEI
jgi:hypothetical protein